MSERVKSFFSLDRREQICREAVRRFVIGGLTVAALVQTGIDFVTGQEAVLRPVGKGARKRPLKTGLEANLAAFLSLVPPAGGPDGVRSNPQERWKFYRLDGKREVTERYKVRF